jgi:hypothetical protein
MSNSLFGDYLHIIYQNELVLKDTTEREKSASYFDLDTEIDNGGILKQILQQTKRGDSNIQFTFHLLNSYFKCFFSPKCESYNFCQI